MASKVKKQVQEELLNTMTLLQEAGQENSAQFNILEGLYNKIDKYDDDKDIVNTVWANKDLPLRMFTTPDLEMMPNFNALLVGEPYKDKVDKDKYFGKDWHKDINDIPYNKIALVAAKEGRSPNTVINEMTEEAIKRNRYDIAHKGVPGFLLSVFTPRRQEAIERGEEPSLADTELDIAQNALYMAPWARVSAPLARLGRIGNIAQGIAGNAITPTVMETADAALYNDDNPRGEFNTGDVITETAVNMTAPWLLRGTLMGAGKLATGKGRDLANKWMQYGTNRTTKEDVPDLLTELNNNQFVKDAVNFEAEKYPNTVSLIRRANAAAYNKESAALRESVINKLDTYQQMPYTGEPNFTQEELKLIATDPEIRKLVDIDVLPTNQELAGEEAVKNYLTNEYGSAWFDEGESPYTRIPVVGSRIDRYIKNRSSEAKRRKNEEDILNEYRINLFGGK